ncbi:hypothetical protein TWF225_001153 [Orbilia oligospora]|nr:hypothetical protein TWF225_001153 [Orbilia oligospora]KAF3238129.1 hypothetical protein TWF217_001771 [Orbilia oligospora]KAF3276491.1 hypothetical protein TWF132_002147 [Orbilia oligospora]
MSKMGVGKLDFSKVKDTGQAVNLDTAQLTVTIPDNQLNTLKVKALVYFARIATGIKEPFVLIGGYAMELYGMTDRETPDIDIWTEEYNYKDGDQMVRLELVASTTLSTMVAANPCAVSIVPSENIKFAIANPAELYSNKRQGLTGGTPSRSLSQRIKDGKDALWLLGDKLKPNGNLVAVRGLLHSMLFGSAPTEEAFSAEVNFLISTIKKLEVQKGEEGKE